MSSRSGDRGKGATGERARGRAVGRAKERAGVEGTRRSEGGRGARSPTRAQQSTTAAKNFGSKTSGADRRRPRPEAERPRAAPRAPEGPLVQPGHRARAPAVARAPTAATGVRRPRPCIKLRTIQVRTKGLLSALKQPKSVRRSHLISFSSDGATISPMHKRSARNLGEENGMISQSLTVRRTDFIACFSRRPGLVVSRIPSSTSINASTSHWQARWTSWPPPPLRPPPVK